MVSSRVFRGATWVQGRKREQKDLVYSDWPPGRARGGRGQPVVSYEEREKHRDWAMKYIASTFGSYICATFNITGEIVGIVNKRNWFRYSFRFGATQ